MNFLTPRQMTLASIVIFILISTPLQSADRFTVSPLKLPDRGEAILPQVAVDAYGQVHLAWIELDENQSASFWTSELTEQGWSDPGFIAQENNWILNAVDPPGLHALSDGTLIAHWSERSGRGYLTRLQVLARTHTSSAAENLAGTHTQNLAGTHTLQLHDDAHETEHGFVSSAMNWFFWLEGMPTSDATDSNGIGTSFPPVTTGLKARAFTSGSMAAEMLLDEKVCDCCTTAAAEIENGLLVVYRDRDDDELRDIAYVRMINGAWQTSRTLHRDNWRTKGCPMNGPAIDAVGKTIAVAWYSKATNPAQINLAWSLNNGESFSNPIRLDEGGPLGQVDIAVLKEGALVVWREMKNGEVHALFKIVSTYGAVLQSGTLNNHPLHRRLGTPRIAIQADHALVVWTRSGLPASLSGIRIDPANKPIFDWLF